jgi:hypothetical protein
MTFVVGSDIFASIGYVFIQGLMPCYREILEGALTP